MFTCIIMFHSDLKCIKNIFLTLGCVLLIQLLMPFSGIYCLLFPLFIAFLRYCLVVHSNWTKSIGINRLVTIIIFLSVVVPSFMTFSLQFPVANHIHGPYNNCVGRFEIFFDPTHPDPITSGLVCFQFLKAKSFTIQVSRVYCRVLQVMILEYQNSLIDVSFHWFFTFHP